MEATIDEVKKEIESQQGRSAWDKGVTAYALELLEKLEEYRDFEQKNKYINPSEIRKELLNGADSWHQYSWGGSSLIYDYDIAARLCTASELKKTDHGYRRPNRREEWLDVQARALKNACNRIILTSKLLATKAEEKINIHGLYRRDNGDEFIHYAVTNERGERRELLTNGMYAWSDNDKNAERMCSLTSVEHIDTEKMENLLNKYQPDKTAMQALKIVKETQQGQTQIRKPPAL